MRCLIRRAASASSSLNSLVREGGGDVCGTDGKELSYQPRCSSLDIGILTADDGPGERANRACLIKAMCRSLSCAQVGRVCSHVGGFMCVQHS